MITSLSNDKIKYITSLQKKKNRHLNKQFIIEGINSINEANNYIVEIYTTEENSKYDDAILVSKEVMQKMYLQQPVVKYIALCNFISEEINFEDKILALNNIKDPGNLGTILRTGLALGYKNILLDENCVDIYNDKVLRAMHGSQFHLNINITDLYKTLNKSKNQIITTFLDEKHSVSKRSDNNHILVLGNESNGIDLQFKNIDHTNFKIKSEFESLNVASAASIIMYALRGE